MFRRRRWRWRSVVLSVAVLIFVCGASIYLLSWRVNQRGDAVPGGSLVVVSRQSSVGSHVPLAGQAASLSEAYSPRASSSPVETPLGIDDVCASSFLPNISYNSAPNKDDRLLLRFISALHTVIPPSSLFAPTIRNPCWYMHLSNPSRIRQDLQDSMEFTDLEATVALGRAVTSKYQHLVCLPKIFFIGFPRSGSTQMYEMLLTHPDIVSGLTKEPHWWTKFSFDERFPHNVIAVLRYITHFASASEHIQLHPNALAIDASQSTIWDTRMLSNICILPALISSVIPDAKYIVAMREPGSRLFSDFRYLAHRLRWSKSMNISNSFHEDLLQVISDFNVCLQNDSIESCTHLSTVKTRVRLGVSLYYVHVAKWLRAIPRNQFIFIRMEDLSENPDTVLKELWEFLELTPQTMESLNETLRGHANMNKLNVELLPSTRQVLSDFFRPFNQKLGRLLNDKRFLWEDVLE